MARLMRCKYCGTLQDEPQGAKRCMQCGGELVFLADDPWTGHREGSYVRAQLELDQIAAPAEQAVQRHLVITVETPDEIPEPERAQAAAGREALHFVAVLDMSGSMRGAKIEAAKSAVRQAVQRLQEGDVLSLVTFATDVRCPLSAKRVDANLRRVIESSLSEIAAGGQTALCGGLELGIKQARSQRLGTTLVLLLSDGQANVGETDVEAVGRRALDARRKGLTVSTLGVGGDYNEAMMAEIALEGGGRFYHIADARQIAAYLTGELGEMAALAARDAVVDLHLPSGTGVRSLSAAYPVQGHSLSLGDIPLATTLEAVVRVSLAPQPAGSEAPMGGVLRYRSPAGHALRTQLNEVAVRYIQEVPFQPVEGAVKPVVRRVLEQMQAASVLATSRAATHGFSKARQQGSTDLAAMRAYAALLGEDEQVEDMLADSEQVLQFLHEPSMGARAKAATYAAARKMRGSKDFDNA